MDAGEENMKERIWLSRMKYSVLKEKMRKNECGWCEYVEPLYAPILEECA
jgi:hypothetical protein